jgi:hypothetical protein
MRGTFLALVLLLAACGSPNAPQAQSSIPPTATAATTQPTAPSPSATSSGTTSPHHVTPPAAGLLFAVVENVVASGCCGGEPTGVSADTVAIVDINGHTKAKATFLPRKLPAIGNSAIILQAPALVAAHGIYFLDGTGTVRVLRVNSSSQVVATFVQQGQPYETWFAVSPDGSRIVGTVVTYDSVGSYFHLYTAPSGGTSTLYGYAEGVGTPESQYSGQPFPFPIGWISAGPVAMEPSTLTSQNAWLGGPLEVLTFAPDGLQTSRVGGTDCHSASITQGGLIPCISSKGVVSVRDTTGKVIWTTQVAGFNAASLFLSPDGQAISDGQQASSDGGATWYMVVEAQARGAIQMPKEFRIEGWLDSNTVIGAVTPPGSGDEGNLSWVSLDDPSTVHDLGFRGDFVATLS